MFLYYTRTLLLSILTLTGSMLLYGAEQQQQPGTRTTSQQPSAPTPGFLSQATPPPPTTPPFSFGAPSQPTQQAPGYQSPYESFPRQQPFGEGPFAAVTPFSTGAPQAPYPPFPGVSGPSAPGATLPTPDIFIPTARDPLTNKISVLLVHKKGGYWVSPTQNQINDFIQELGKTTDLEAVVVPSEKLKEIFVDMSEGTKKLLIAVTPLNFVPADQLRNKLVTASSPVDDFIWVPIDEFTTRMTALSKPLSSSAQKSALGKSSLAIVAPQDQKAIKAAASKISTIGGTPLFTKVKAKGTTAARPTGSGQPSPFVTTPSSNPFTYRPVPLQNPFAAPTSPAQEVGSQRGQPGQFEQPRGQQFRQFTPQGILRTGGTPGDPFGGQPRD